MKGLNRPPLNRGLEPIVILMGGPRGADVVVAVEVAVADEGADLCVLALAVVLAGTVEGGGRSGEASLGGSAGL